MSHKAEYVDVPINPKVAFLTEIRKADAEFGSQLAISNEQEVKNMLGDALGLGDVGVRQETDFTYYSRQKNGQLKAQFFVYVDNIPERDFAKEVIEGVVEFLVTRKCSQSIQVWDINAAKKGDRKFLVTMTFRPGVAL